MREEMLRAVLSDLNGSSADIIGSAVVSTDGLMIAACCQPISTRTASAR
ncbi:MAG: hypothetical protein ACK4Q4_05380 [Rhodocyclaceae bacterium]